MEKPIIINNQKKKRPDLLTLLCILTFIGSGLQLISNLFLLLNKEYILENLEESTFNLEDFQPILEMPSEFFQFNALFFIIAFVGSILMWNLKKIGFHIYSLAQIALLFIISVFNPLNSFPLAEILITSLFILLYYRHLKFMN